MKRDLHVCVSVLNELKSQILQARQAAAAASSENSSAASASAEDLVEELRAELCLPVQTEDRAALKLAPLAECTYCDEEWLRQGASDVHPVFISAIFCGGGQFPPPPDLQFTANGCQIVCSNCFFRPGQ